MSEEAKDRRADELANRLYKKYGTGPHYLADIVQIWYAACDWQRKRDAEIANNLADQLAVTNSLTRFGNKIAAAIMEDDSERS